MTKASVARLTTTELFHKVSEICAAVNLVTNTRDLLEVSLKRTMELFGAQRGSIFILDESGKTLILKSSLGLAVGEEKSIVKRLGEGVVGQVAEMKKPIFVADIAKDDRFRGHKSNPQYRSPSFICAPLLLKDKLIGVINITEKESDDHFNEDELQLLDFLSSQIALNYRRVQLYEKFKAMLKESQTLKDELGKSSKEATHLKRQVVQHERLASIGKLAGGIAHEFNNPLDGVMRYTNLCLEQANEDEVVRGYLLEIKHGLNRMANIVKSLLACSRSADVALHKTNPNTSLEQSLQALQAVVMHKGVKIVKDLGKDLPEIDDMGLERIFTNLIHNAIDAVPTGGWIKVSTFREDDHLGISVSDNGCGIEENRIQQIFEPFHTTKDIDKGCGLGLTIVSEIVKSYDGHIRVESSPGAGTTFTVMVPIKESYV